MYTHFSKGGKYDFFKLGGEHTVVYHTIYYKPLSTTYKNLHSIKNLVFVVQALCGVLVDIPTLTGEKIPINLANEIVKPSTVKRIPGYGLPLPKEPTKRGDILVSFDIQFPDKLSQNSKDLLYELLPAK